MGVMYYKDSNGDTHPVNKGTKGDRGYDGPSGGDSAYTLAVANGFVGTEEEWLASLVGATGPLNPTEDYLERTGDAMTGDLGLGGNKLLDVNSIHVIDALGVTGGSIAVVGAGGVSYLSDGGYHSFNGQSITEVAEPTNDADVATKNYVDAAVSFDFPDVGWQDMSLENGWVPYGIIPGGFGGNRFCRRNGIVFVSLMAKDGTEVGTAHTVTTLPVGFRPLWDTIHAGATVGDIYTRFTMYESGRVSVDDMGGVGWIALNISYPAEQ